MIRDKTWVKSAACANGKIKELIAAPGRPQPCKNEPRPPEVPPLRPAALEPAWSQGRLILLSKSTECDCDSVVFAATLKLLSAEVASVADDANRDGNIDRRSIACLRSVARRIPGYTPPQDELFYLAHVKVSLEAYAKFVNDEWPVFLAKRYNDVICYFDRAVRQFEKWRDFVTNTEKDRLTAEEATNVPALAEWMVAALREDEARILIDQAIPSRLEVFQAPLQNYMESVEQQALGAIEAGKLLLANDLLESIDNITKRIAEAALGINSSAPPNGKRGLSNEAFSSREKDSRRAYMWMTRTLFGLMADAPTRALDSTFCWLKPIVSLLCH
jgi:hypothetical protein